MDTTRIAKWFIILYMISPHEYSQIMQIHDERQ